MQAVIFMGVQASGKSSFYRDRFADTHLRLNPDMLRTRHLERLILGAFIKAKASFVVDNTNPTAQDRARDVQPSKAAGFRVVGYYSASSLADALERNSARREKQRVPGLGTKRRFPTSSCLRPPRGLTNSTMFG